MRTRSHEYRPKYNKYDMGEMTNREMVENAIILTMLFVTMAAAYGGYFGLIKLFGAH